MSDDRAVVDWPAIPLAGDRVRVDRERLVPALVHPDLLVEIEAIAALD